MKSINVLNRKRDMALAEMIRSIGTGNFAETLSYFVGKTVAFDNLIILVYHNKLTPEELYRENNDPIVHQTIQSHYVRAAYLLDPFYHAINGGIQSGIHRIFDIAPDQFKQTSYFHEYYYCTTLIDEFALFARIDHETTLTACFGRDKTSGLQFTKAEMKRIKSFESILSALCEKHWRNYQPVEGKNVSLPPITSRLRTKMKNEYGISLSPRQSEVAFYILQGHSSLSISLNLNISKETVKVFRKQLYSKCNISSQAELFALLMPIFPML